MTENVFKCLVSAGAFCEKLNPTLTVTSFFSSPQNVSGWQIFSHCFRNKSGTAQVGAPIKVQKDQSVLNMRRDTIVKTFINLPRQNTRKDTQETGKPLLPCLETAKNVILKKKMLVTGEQTFVSSNPGLSIFSKVNKTNVLLLALENIFI